MPTQQGESPTYQSYLVRLWRDKPSSPWRVSLQSTATEELRHRCRQWVISAIF
jgi:hypothetical protein